MIILKLILRFYATNSLGSPVVHHFSSHLGKVLGFLGAGLVMGESHRRFLVTLNHEIAVGLSLRLHEIRGLP